jgi:MFS transporter, PAT family, beta-lactamase induction signal transducer AmpG
MHLTFLSQKKTLFSVLLMGIASGLPYLLTQTTLQTWLATESSLSLDKLGLMSLLGLPYLLKCLWSPYLDQIKLPWSTQRLSWLQISQVGVVLCLLALSYCQPSHLRLLFTVALFTAFFAASQDIVIDGYRIEQLTPQNYGYGIMLTQIGFRLAMVASGAGAMILAFFTSWSFAYRIMALLMGILFVFSLFYYREQRLPLHQEATKPSWLAPWKTLWQRPHKWPLLLLIAGYPIADHLTTALMPTYLIRVIHFNAAQVGVFYKTWGLAATIAGSALAAYTTSRTSIQLNLAIYAALLGLSFIGFLLAPHYHYNLWPIMLTLGFNQLCHGASTTALVTLMSQLCEQPFCASHYACFTSISGAARVFLGPVAAWLILHGGWASLFITALVILCVTSVLIILPQTRSIYPQDTCFTTT